MVSTKPEKVGLVEFANVTAEDLKRSRVNNSYLEGIWVRFESENIPYTAAHFYETKRISLYRAKGVKEDASDLNSIADIIAKETNGIKEGGVKESRLDVSMYVNLPHSPTQSSVADFAEKYSKHFKNVTIQRVVFLGVPMDVYKNSGLPQEKLFEIL